LHIFDCCREENALDAIALRGGADARLLELTRKLTPDDLSAPTPCDAWDVRSLLSHTLQSIEAFSAAVDGRGGPTEEELFGGSDILGDDPSGVASRIAERSASAWATVADWGGQVSTVLGPMPASQAVAIVTFSTLVHSWDLARAIGDCVEFTEDEALLAEAVGGQLVPAMRPGGLFGAEVEVGPDATPTQRVIAFTGRAPV
jgi:uncharacterized protein (TIGR03086 family)